MDVLDLLKSDHQRVSDLFHEAETASSWKKKRVIFESIRNELELHTYVEETIFYPTLRDFEGFQREVQDSFQDHAEITDLLEQIDQLPPESHLITEKLSILQQRVERHVREEEHVLFPKSLEVLDRSERENLGQQIWAAKHEREEAA